MNITVMGFSTTYWSRLSAAQGSPLLERFGSYALNTVSTGSLRSHYRYGCKLAEQHDNLHLGIDFDFYAARRKDSNYRLTRGISHRQTVPTSTSSSMPTNLIPTFLKTRVDAFSSGNVCAQTTCTRMSRKARRINSAAANVAIPCPRNKGAVPYARVDFGGSNQSRPERKSRTCRSF